MIDRFDLLEILNEHSKAKDKEKPANDNTKNKDLFEEMDGVFA